MTYQLVRSPPGCIREVQVSFILNTFVRNVEVEIPLGIVLARYHRAWQHSVFRMAKEILNLLVVRDMAEGVTNTLKMYYLVVHKNTCKCTGSQKANRLNIGFGHQT